MNEQTTPVTESKAAAAAGASTGTSPENLRGRAVFAVETSGAGIVVRTAFLTEQQQVIDMPAVFPDLTYALAQIDSLRQVIIERFTEAAQIGIQVMAAQAAAREAQTERDATVTAVPSVATPAHSETATPTTAPTAAPPRPTAASGSTTAAVAPPRFPSGASSSQ